MSSQILCINPDCTSKKVHLCGSYVRKSDAQEIQRYRCAQCKRSFSSATFHPCYRQKKRHKNNEILKLLSASVSQRRIAILLNLNKKTVHRKFLFLALICALKNLKYLNTLKNNPLTEVYMDEMEDKVHTKCKPVSIAVMVSENREILGHFVSPIMPKNKNLYKICLEKYPHWKDQSKKGFGELLKKAQGVLLEKVKIHTDDKLMYKREIKLNYPHSIHIAEKSRRAVIAGLGELKEGGYDPLFPLNHTCAMIRANVNRLVRRTWCTTKKLENLSKHIEIYTYFHNTRLLKV